MNYDRKGGHVPVSRPAAMTDPVSFDDRYDIRRLLGSGGMSRVMLAYDRVRGEEVALKLLHRGFARKWLTAEFRYISSLDHPGIVKVHDFGVTSTSRPYFTMERVEGPDLYEFSERADLVTTVHVIRSALDTLRFVHARGVVHCDLKPSNILVASDPQSNHMAKLLDFGVAWGLDDVVDNPGGTMDYMAPETFDKNVRTPHSDLYSMGVVLFEILTGRVPFAPGTAEASRRAIAKRQAPDPRDLVPDTPGPLAEITMRLLETNPRDRFASARALSESLRMWALSVMPRRRSRVSTVSMLARPKQVIAGNPRLIGREAALRTLMDGAERVERDGKPPPTLLAVTGQSGWGATSLVSEARLRVQLGGGLWLAVDLHGVTGIGEGLSRIASVVAGHSNRATVVDDVQRALVGEERADAALGIESPAVERLIGTTELVASAIDALTRNREVTLCLDGVDAIAPGAVPIIRNLIQHVNDIDVPVVLTGDRRDEGLASIMAARPDVETVSLQPLTDAQTRELVVSMLGECSTSVIADHVFAETNGNPRAAVAAVRALVASESLREREGVWHVAEHLGGQLPSMSEEASVRQVALAAVKSLSPSLRRVAELAAIVGETFDIGLLSVALEKFAASLPATEPSIRGLLDRRIIVHVQGSSRSESYRFSQPAIRRLLRHGVLPEEARTVSRSVALELERRQSSGEPVELTHLARHLVAADRHDDAIRCGLSAARRLLADGAVGLAEELITMLADAAHGLSGEDERWVELTTWLGDLAKGRGDLDTAMRRYSSVGPERDDEVGLLARLKLGDIHLEQGAVAEGRVIVDAVLDAARRKGDKAIESRAAYALGFHHVVSGNYDDGEPYVLGALDAAELAEDELLEARALKLRSLLGWYRGELLDSEVDARESARICVELGLNRGAAEALGLLGGLCKRTGRVAESRSFYQEALVFARRAQWLTGIGKLHNSLAVLSYYSDAWDNAQAHYAQGLAISERTGNRVERVLLLNNLGLVSANRGEDETAVELYEESLEVARACGLQVEEARVLGNLGELRVLRGDLKQGEEMLTRCLEICTALGHKGLEVECRRRLLEHCLARGVAPQIVLDRLDGLRELMTGDGFAMERGHLFRLQGEALAILGLPEEAETALVTARDIFQDLGCGYESARAVRTAAMLAHQGLIDPDGVASGFREARRLFRSLGANPELELSRGIQDMGKVHAPIEPKSEAPRTGWSPVSDGSTTTVHDRFMATLNKLNQIEDSDSFWEAFLDDCLILSRAQRGYVLEVTPSSRSVMRAMRHVVNGHATNHHGSVHDIAQAVIHHVCVTQQPLYFQAGVDPALSTSVDVVGRSLACIPLMSAGNLMGLVYLDHSQAFMPRDSPEMQMVHGLVVFAASRLGHATERRRNDRYRATLKTARRLLNNWLKSAQTPPSQQAQWAAPSHSSQPGIADHVEQIRTLLLVLDEEASDSAAPTD